jgi:hypothetical protein
VKKIVGQPQATTSSELRRPHCCHTGTRELAVIIPDAATAGTPIPGIVLSPQHRRPGMFVAGPGNDSFPALTAGPYVPSLRRK